MDWSATLSLTTSHMRQHRANYGSFTPSVPLKRHGSSSTISIPESIPEQDVVQFATPHLNCADVPVLDFAARKASYMSSSQTVTLTEKKTPEATRLQTFKMLLTSSLSSSDPNRIHGGAARAASDDHLHEVPHSKAEASSYWLRERERMRLERERRHLVRNGSPTKAATLRDDDDPEMSTYRTVTIMCSVPLVLVIVFVVILLVFGDGSVASDAAVVFSGSGSPTPSYLRSAKLPLPPAAAIVPNLRAGAPNPAPAN